MFPFAGKYDKLSPMKAAAILLCAGKGTRMGNATINKVAFDCAGQSVVRRIVENLREGGVERFVVVVGHHAQSVMSALHGEKGVLYAFQAEQKGTGHAAQCGLDVLNETGFAGNVIVTMGDKIISSKVVSELLSRQNSGMDAVLAVQKRPEGPTSRGHVVFKGTKVCGIVEAKDVKKALSASETIRLCGYEFSAREVSETKYVNAALYSFNSESLSRKLQKLKSDNAQGEFYLTDTIEGFASEGSLDTYLIENDGDMLTFSTRKELREMTQKFLRPVSSIPPRSRLEKDLFDAFLRQYGDKKVVVSSAPGRINLMGRHIEHRGGSVNMMAVSNRFLFVAARRDDDIVNITNLDESYSSASFRISDFVDVASPQTGEIENSAKWVDFLSSAKAKNDILQNKGHWVNYVKSAVLRLQMATDMPLYGMDVIAAGDIPVAAGLSSSSAVVVAAAEAVVALNALNIPVRDFVDLCGEGEWYVGSRGGAGDHAAMKCSRKGFVTHLKFKPFEIAERYPFFKNCSVVVVNSGEKAKKSEGALKVFNDRISSYERAFAQVRKTYPEMPVGCFRDIAFLPAEDRAKALAAVEPSDRGVALFGVNECRRAEDCLAILKENDPVAMGEMMKDSHNGDRLGYGQYECSTVLIDSICDGLNSMEGVFGSQIVGAGLGGCVIALVENRVALPIVERFRAKGFESFVCESGDGSSIAY